MIITELTLKNCGPFKDANFTFDSGFNPHYGGNETGKSTTSQAVVDVLFGRPEKELYSLVHSVDQLEIEVQIQKGEKPYIFVQKSGLFSQRSITRGDEKLYTSRTSFADYFIPAGIDKSFYQSAFRLNADELKQSRELFAKDTGKINAVLFDAMGNETFSELPIKLDVEADKLFSPSRNSKKKLVNKLLIEIEELKNEIQAHTLTSEQYANQVKHINILKTKSKGAQDKITALDHERDKTLSKLQLNADNYFRYLELKEEIERVEDTLPLTEQKIETISEHLEELKSRKVTITDLKGRISTTSETLNGINVDEEILSKEAGILKLGESKILYIENKNTLSKLQNDIERLDLEIQEKVKGLNLLVRDGGISKEEIDQLSLSGDIEGGLYKLLKKVDEKLHHNIPMDIDEVKGKKLSDSAKQLGSDINVAKEDIQTLRDKIKAKEDDIAQITIEVDTNKLDEARRDRDIKWSEVKSNLSLISDASDDRVRQFESTQDFLNETVSSIIKDAEQVGKRGALQDELNTLNVQHIVKTEAYVVLKDKIPEMKSAWDSYCREALHTLDLSTKNFSTWNEQRKNTIMLINRRSLDKDKLIVLTGKIETYEKDTEVLNTFFDENGDVVSIVETLVGKLSKAASEKNMLQANSETLRHDEGNLEDYEKKQGDQLEILEAFFPEKLKGLSFDAIQSEIDKTIKSFDRRRDFSTLKDDLTIKFGEDIRLAFKEYDSKQAIEEGYQSIADKISEERNILDEARKELSLLEDEVKEALSEDEEILEKHQMLESKKLELKTGIDEYLHTKISSRVISRLNSLLSTQAAKDLIVKAGEYFEVITGGRYKDLSITGDSFYAQRKKSTSVAKEGVLNSIVDGDEFITVQDNQMSEGTKDQLFLSLRLAFIAIFNETSDKKLPFIADDILVNFDDERIENALRLLKEFSKTTQVFFFTHSSRIMEIWDKAKE